MKVSSCQYRPDIRPPSPNSMFLEPVDNQWVPMVTAEDRRCRVLSLFSCATVVTLCMLRPGKSATLPERAKIGLMHFMLGGVEGYKEAIINLNSMNN